MFWIRGYLLSIIFEKLNWFGFLLKILQWDSEINSEWQIKVDELKKPPMGGFFILLFSASC